MQACVCVCVCFVLFISCNLLLNKSTHCGGTQTPAVKELKLIFLCPTWRVSLLQFQTKTVQFIKPNLFFLILNNIIANLGTVFTLYILYIGKFCGMRKSNDLKLFCVKS